MDFVAQEKIENVKHNTLIEQPANVETVNENIEPPKQVEETESALIHGGCPEDYRRAGSVCIPINVNKSE
ncbi:unnamed protein product [Euphydryas editha]|uniref:Uncharacterized protein n=1 Tax=Euphydryas editha TaxID=104508 RepID=A0AAU9U486_EUPED|nr:unnamed protein product [Euphydryas editha]